MSMNYEKQQKKSYLCLPQYILEGVVCILDV